MDWKVVAENGEKEKELDGVVVVKTWVCWVGWKRKVGVEKGTDFAWAVVFGI